MKTALSRSISDANALSYLRFIFARAARPAEAETALRIAHRWMHFDICLEYPAMEAPAAEMTGNSIRHGKGIGVGVTFPIDESIAERWPGAEKKSHPIRP